MTSLKVVPAPAVQPPLVSETAEQAVIGGLLIASASGYEKVAGIVRDIDFFYDDHRLIFRHIAALARTGKDVDVITVMESLESCSELDRCGGLARLGELADGVPSISNIAAYADIVADKARKRDLAKALSSLAEQVAHPGSSFDAMLSEVSSSLDVLSARRGVSSGSIATMSEAANEFTALLQRRLSGSIVAVSTGLVDLDRQINGGLHDSKLVVIGGRPGSGKTSLAINIAETVARNGRGALVISLEMPVDELTGRIVSRSARVDSSAIARGDLSNQDNDAIEQALVELQAIPLFIRRSSSIMASDLSALVRGFKADCMRQGIEPGVVVLDYIQLVTGSAENRNLEIAAITRELKLAGLATKIPIIALSQLSRDVEKRVDKRPVMSDFRESGAIEQDADIVIGLYRDEYYNPDSIERGVAEAIVLKHRGGPTGTVKLAFLGQYTEFGNLAMVPIAADPIVDPKPKAKTRRVRHEALD